MLLNVILEVYENDFQEAARAGESLGERSCSLSSLVKAPVNSLLFPILTPNAFQELSRPLRRPCCSPCLLLLQA